MTLHTEALATLREWQPPSAEQEALRARYVAHLQSHPDGLSRECLPDHLTASTLVLSDDLLSVLLTLHAKAGEWFQLGGHCEADDATLADAALREATEESGVPDLDLDPVPLQLSEHAVPFCGVSASSTTGQERSSTGQERSSTGQRVTHHLDVRFLAIAPTGARERASDESHDVAWWPVTGLPTQEPDIVELVELGLRRAQSAGLV